MTRKRHRLEVFLVVVTSVKMSFKLDGFLRPYRGKEDDLSAFWSKFLVLAAANSWDTEEKKATHLPLLLDKAAYQVFDALSDDNKKKPDEIKAALSQAFAMSAAEAYRSFTARVMRRGESVDAYVAELKRLLVLSKHKIADDDKDPMLMEQMIRGLPRDFSREVRIQCSGNDMTITDIMTRVRAMAVDDDGGASSRPVAAVVECHNCHGFGHMRKDCPNKGAGSGKGSSPRQEGQRSGNASRGPKCFRCKEYGHIRRNCPQQAKKMGGAAVAVDKQMGVQVDKSCQGADDTSSGTDTRYEGAMSCGSSALVSVSVQVEVPGVNGGVHEVSVVNELSAIVDTGCTRSLVSEAALATISGAAERIAPTCTGVVGIDGKPLGCVGSVLLEICQHNDVLCLPKVPVDFLVVSSHDGVEEDIIIGNDVISAAGGINIGYEHGHVKSVVFGRDRVNSEVTATAQTKTARNGLSRHISVDRLDNGDVVLRASDFCVRWDAQKRHWILAWQWLDGKKPARVSGPAIGEYSRSKLTSEQEQHYRDEVKLWIDNGWLVPHDLSRHGEPASILPLMAVCQEHKPTTPVRPCLDYRHLNDCIVSHPGVGAPVCGQKLREWRRRGVECAVVDVSKAYLQVHIDPSLMPYQTVKFDGVTYVMERMGFGLSVAPKVMDSIVKFALESVPDADNYVDDVVAPDDQLNAVKDALGRYGLPTKPAESLEEARVLGLQLAADNAGVLCWSRRDGVDLALPEKLTKRKIFSWCGRLVGHYPVGSWLRPMCSLLKRKAVKASADAWDVPVPEEIVVLCRELERRVAEQDPVRGQWQVQSDVAASWSVWCDASNLAMGVVLMQGDVIIEDQCWLRPSEDKQHINVAELDAVVKGLNLVITYRAEQIAIKTDSKTVHGWLKALLHDVHRVKVGGLYEALVRRRLQLIEDIVSSYGLRVTVEWVPTSTNVADALTRVPQTWLKNSKIEVSAVSTVVPGPLKLSEIRTGQSTDPVLARTLKQLQDGQEVTAKSLQRVRTQLRLSGGLLLRSVKVPPDETLEVPVLPPGLEDEAMEAAHLRTGHGSWESTHRLLRSQCYFPDMATKVQTYIADCGPCRAANPQGVKAAAPSRPVIPGGPWQVVQMDTLHLGPSRSGHHSVLVCYDMFTKWVEVAPLKNHTAEAVANAFIEVCARWGAPEVIRADNGAEFVNATMDALYDTFGVVVKHGAVRHPKSQGAVERFNRTLLTMLRKLHEQSTDWKTDLAMFLHFYRVRPHSVLKISPAKAILGWEPRNLVVQQDVKAEPMCKWSADLERNAARIRDFVEEELSAEDFLESEEEAVSPFAAGDPVQLRRPDRSQKLLPAFERGWYIKKVLSPSTVVIAKGKSEKLVNVDLIKLDVVDDVHEEKAEDCSASAPDDDESGYELQYEPTVVPHRHRYGLRDRVQLRPPSWRSL